MLVFLRANRSFQGVFGFSDGDAKVCVGKRTYEARSLVFGGTLFLTWDSVAILAQGMRALVLALAQRQPRDAHAKCLSASRAVSGML